jgi:hypothetical protein
LERSALHLRFVLELLALSSLVTRPGDFDRVASSLRNKGAKAARKLALGVNVDYWPNPVIQQQKAPGQFDLPSVEAGFLTEADWGREFGFTSSLLHARNPDEEPPDWQGAVVRLRGLVDGLIRLLDHHVVHLAGGDHMLACSMKTAETGDIQVALFKRADMPAE